MTDGHDWDLDGLRDDHGLETFLVSEGHFVDIRPYYWRELDPGKIAALKAADLILLSRLANSAYYDDDDEPRQWNSLPVPLLQMNAYFARNNRWEWVNSDLTTDTTVVAYLEAVEPDHPIFRNVPMIALGSGGRRIPTRVVPAIDPKVGSGITSFTGVPYTGQGRLLAKPAGWNLGWIAEWDAGVEFYVGAGQYAGAKRLLFCAGTQEIQIIDPVTQGTRTTTQGELNLTPEGRQMFRNAIAYLLPKPKPKP